MRSKERTVRIDRQTAPAIDRYLRARAGTPRRTGLSLWLGVNGRRPLGADGIYQMIRRRGREAGVAVYPHRFRHHFSQTWLGSDGEGDSWNSTAGPPRRCSTATPAAPAPAAPTTASWKTTRKATARNGCQCCHLRGRSLHPLRSARTLAGPPGEYVHREQGKLGGCYERVSLSLLV
jgi:hypothetical protein